MRYLQEIQSRYINFFAPKILVEISTMTKFLPKREFSNFEKGGKSINSQQICSYVIEMLKFVSNVLENTEKSIYLQFGRFRWPESADPADLTKSENFMFFDFLRSFYVHFPHCKFDEYRILGWNYNAENNHFTWNLAHFTAKLDHFTL